MSGSSVAWIKNVSAGPIMDVAIATLVPIASSQSGGYLVAALRSSNEFLHLLQFGVDLNGEIALGTNVSAGKVFNVVTTNVTTSLATRFVTGIHNHEGNLQCDVWDFDSGSLLRKGKVLGGPISELAVAGLPPGPFLGGRFFTAARTSTTDLEVSVHDISDNGEIIITRGKGSAGSIGFGGTCVTNFKSSSRVVTAAARSPDGHLMLVVWDVGPNGEVTKKGEAFAGPVSEVTICALSKDSVATAVRTSDGFLKIINWTVDANGNITRKGGGAYPGIIQAVASTTLIPGKLATAVRTQDSHLKVFVWVVANHNLDLTRNGDGHIDLFRVDKVAITETGSDQNGSNFVTAVRGLDDGNLHIVTWSETDLS